MHIIGGINKVYVEYSSSVLIHTLRSIDVIILAILSLVRYILFLKSKNLYKILYSSGRFCLRCHLKVTKSK